MSPMSCSNTLLVCGGRVLVTAGMTSLLYHRTGAATAQGRARINVHVVSVRTHLRSPGQTSLPQAAVRGSEHAMKLGQLGHLSSEASGPEPLQTGFLLLEPSPTGELSSEP